MTVDLDALKAELVTAGWRVETETDFPEVIFRFDHDDPASGLMFFDQIHATDRNVSIATYLHSRVVGRPIRQGDVFLNDSRWFAAIDIIRRHLHPTPDTQP